MTAQIEDSIKFLYKKYDIVAIQKSWPFHPEDIDMLPVGCSSDCWRGFVCEYAVTTKGLKLKNLYINVEEDYKPINGVEAVPSNMGMMVYKNLNLDIEYSGGIIIAADFMHEYYVHMGFQAPVSYKTVYELVFDKGQLIEKIDHSDKMKKVREENEFINHERDNVYGICEAFSLDYGNKWTY
ncbi:MAG: hypothetical protein ACRCST_04115 [Turicibacter sp.]